MANSLTENARDLEEDLEWLARLIEHRLAAYFKGATDAGSSLPLPVPPAINGSGSPYAHYLRERQLTPARRAIVLLALAPHVRPQLLDVLLTRNEATQRTFTEFGGTGTVASGFQPTVETALFLLAGDDLAKRFELLSLFAEDGGIVDSDGLLIESTGGDSILHAPLLLAPSAVQRFTTGRPTRPSFGINFPARRIETRLSWSDLVLPNSTLEQLEEIKRWILHGDRLLNDWEMGDRLQPGFTALFHGPPGTGKTLSACLLGRHCGCDVYKVDLSMVVSKYIGETEKNLGRIFDLAEHERWILFFDEADALFGKRTRVSDAHDRYANQEVSYLLQRIEEFRGVVILTSNVKANIDDAFLRRFQLIVQFPMPKAAERRRIWQAGLPTKAELEPGVDLSRLAERYELSGGAIVNVCRYAALLALSRDSTILEAVDLEDGIRRELLKEGRAV